jgi:hypothetical protein
MKDIYQRFFWLVVLCVSITAAEARTFLLMTEDLEMPGGWVAESDTGINKGARRYLIAPTPAVSQAPAVGAVDIPNAGRWRVWVRSKDFANNRPGARSFSLRVGETKLERSFGTHGLVGDDGWAWEDGGTLDLQAGAQLLVLGETCQHSARCEAIVFTDNMSYVPEGVTWLLGKERAQIVPLQMSAESKAAFSAPEFDQTESQPIATLKNEKIRITFYSGQTKAGKAVGMKVASAYQGQWQTLTEKADIGSYRILARPLESDAQISRSRIYPTWDTSLSPIVEVGAERVTAKTRMGPSSVPWLAGHCYPLHPIGAKQRDEKTVELSFAPTPAGQLYVSWILEPGESNALVRMSFKPATPGHYSLGFHAPFALQPEQADSWLLPFQFHQNRFPKDPVLILNSATPTPLSLLNQRDVSCALVADPVLIPFGWQGSDTSRYGFGLRNEKDQAQPLVYSPVLGLPGSRSEGGELSTRFRLWVQRGDWYATYRAVADELFELKDYREPTDFSLTDTVFNLMDLIRNENASGWDKKAKATVQIESRNVVTHSSPLVYMSLYLLTGDVDLYERFARPSLEFLLSRPQTHFAIEQEIGDNYYSHQPMEGPVKFYGATTYASALAMTHGRTPAFGAYSLLPDGKTRRTSPNGHGQPFGDALMLYHVTGEARYLEEAIAGADKYLATLKQPGPLSDPGDRYFVNVAYTTDWEGLLHLYEATGESRFLHAATAGARALLSTFWTQPRIPKEKTVTPNPGGLYDHSRYVWWWADQRVRVGVYEGPASEGPIDTPVPKIPERKVPAWTVSNVGLGLEHPFTYVRRDGQANIMMSNWAANFLRMSEATGDPSYRVAARNAMIGRYANYPGYYLDGQTDEFRRADYPITGPDITSLYVHHIAPFTASVLDFLFADAEVRSKGQVAFPAVRQMGYVWFDSRLWGHAPGLIYGESAWPWLNKEAVTVRNPKVDHLLAHGEGKLHIILMNQSLKEEKVRVKMNESLLGRKLNEAPLTMHLSNQRGRPVQARAGEFEVSIPVQGLAVLSLDGVTIDVPTHRTQPPKHVSLTQAPASPRVAINQTPWHATATIIQAPPFQWRDFYAYVNSTLGEVKSATLRYRLGDGQEQQMIVDRFPFEFSVRVNSKEPIHWSVEVTQADGTRNESAWQKTE